MTPYPHFLKDIYAEMQACAQAAPLVPSQIRRLFLQMIRAHWSDTENHGPALAQSLSCLAWHPDPAVSKVQIELTGSSVASNPPYAIWVSVGNYRFRNIAIGSRATPDEDNAEETHVLAGACQVLVMQEAPTYDQAEDMAWSTFCFLLGFKESLLDALGGEGAAFVPELLGSPKLQTEPPKGRFRVDIGAKLDLNIAVAAVSETHKLKRVAVRPVLASPDYLQS